MHWKEDRNYSAGLCGGETARDDFCQNLGVFLTAVVERPPSLLCHICDLNIQTRSQPASIANRVQKSLKMGGGLCGHFGLAKA